MSYIRGPDLSDSDDDDGYVSYSQAPKFTYKQVIKELTPEEKLNQKKHQLYNAICTGKVDTVTQIIDEGLNVNINLQSNWTPLLLAVSVGNAQLSELLLKTGADSNSTRDGCTALMMACSCPKETSPYSESLKVIKNLVGKGANVKATNRKRMTALMFAADTGNLPAVKYLLPLSDKNAEDNQRWTALFWAVNNNEVDVFKYLLEEDLEFTTPDVRGNTPLDIAKSNDFTEIVDLLSNEENDEIFHVMDANVLSFEEMFALAREGEQPAFFVDICDMLCGMKSESMIKTFADKNITLKQFLSTSDEELKEMGVTMPYQRYRILGGIHKFHKYPYHPKSLHVVPLNETYSNIDVGIQILSAIKQISVMEAGLNYIMKHCDMEDITQEELVSMRKNTDSIKKKIRLCSRVAKKLHEKIKIWDKQIGPTDLITKDSKKYRWPWRKIVFSLTIITIVTIFKTRK
ncbi:unnamed protein product [Psylliodes chrysocephalus]|uniref:SAM domain-containing protein n=1 Tax=Psylliodes chrysocephalus TaxID=3402493 RepID=A0A9P0DEH4_9CUCU|nr:unnamed protein product [Psylliodes chrysocephala]